MRRGLRGIMIRHKAIKTKKMAEDDRESNQKRWKGELVP